MTLHSVANRSNCSCRNGGGVRLQLQCAYVLLGNGITERNHRSIKKIVARKQCTISETKYWYITPKDCVSPENAPANSIYRYQVQENGIHLVQIPDNEKRHGPHTVGDPCGQSSL